MHSVSSGPGGAASATRSARRLVAVAACPDAEQVALLEGQVLDEAVPPKVVDPFVDHDLDHLLARLAADDLAALARARAGDTAAQRAVFDPLRSVIGIPANGFDVVAAVAGRDDAPVAGQAVGARARARR